MTATRPIPDLRYQEAENDLRAAVRDLLDDRCPFPSVLARSETSEPNDPALWKSLAAELGCGGLLIPESHAGAGASYREAAGRSPPFRIWGPRWWRRPRCSAAGMSCWPGWRKDG